MSYFDDEYNERSSQLPRSGRKLAAIEKGVHCPNKNESKLLRKLMHETGMNEVEIRGIQKYRVLLSEAQDAGEKAKRTAKTKFVDKTMKRCTKTLGLAKEHPKVLEMYRAEIERMKGEYWNVRIMRRLGMM